MDKEREFLLVTMSEISAYFVLAAFIHSESKSPFGQFCGGIFSMTQMLLREPDMPCPPWDQEELVQATIALMDLFKHETEEQKETNSDPVFLKKRIDLKLMAAIFEDELAVWRN